MLFRRDVVLKRNSNIYPRCLKYLLFLSAVFRLIFLWFGRGILSILTRIILNVSSTFFPGRIEYHFRHSSALLLALLADCCVMEIIFRYPPILFLMCFAMFTFFPVQIADYE